MATTERVPAPTGSPSSTLAGDTADPNTETKDVEKAPSSSGEAAVHVYPEGVPLLLICVSLLICNFLVALDQTIVAAAVPVIANDFKALSDIGWYGSAYLLTGTATMPIWGKAYSYFSRKWLFIGGVTVFEVGSLICALAHNSKTFIVGRAIAGLGFGNLYVGVLAIISSSLPVAKQGFFTSIIGACYGMGATIGPVIGGSFTTKVTWRWISPYFLDSPPGPNTSLFCLHCFWINLPLGGISLAISILFLNPPKSPQTLTARQRLLRMDWPGTFILLGSVICLLIALQDGGVATPWSSPKSKGLIVGFALLLLFFFATQYVMKENASINLRILAKRNIAFASMANFTIGATYFALLYYVPIYFQAVRGSSAIHSGVQALALIGSAIATVIVSGGAVESSGGVFNPQILIGLALGSIGAGLLSTMNAFTDTGKWIGYQLLAGGIGASFMIPYMASQILLESAERAAGAVCVIFFQTLGATILVSVSNAIYQNELLQGIEKIPGLDVAAVLGSGVSSFRRIVPKELLPAVINVAADSVSKVFLGLAVIAAVGFLAALGLEWKSLKDNPDGGEVNLAGGA